MKALHHILFLMLGCLCACSDIQPFSDDEDPAGFEAGEAVTFTTNVPAHRSAKRSLSLNTDLLEGYSTIQEDYALTIKMYEEGQAEAIGTATYKPKAADVATEAKKGYDETGLLEPEGAPNTPLHWPTNHKRYAFEATAGTDVLETDQSTPALWLEQDRLHGYAYMPLLDDAKVEDDKSVDRIDALNYHTNKEWGAMNKVWKDAMGEMLRPEDYKHIPLFMQHQRAWITVILKAGEGVKREALHFDNASTNIRMAINSFTKEGSNLIATPITEPLASEYLINYEKDANGEAQTNVSTTRYDAIVEPYNYGGARKEEDIIAKINLSDQHFSFYAGNDNRYINGKGEEAKADADYNLEAGKHLTLEVTLSRESRKILITAWVEDWTEVATSTICDDYGQNGTPIVIKNREELIAFLANSKTNRQGSVGIIQPTEMNLDAPDDWTDEYDLNATLNMAGCTLSTKHRLFNSMSSSANLLNGTILMGEGAKVDCAIARTNDGTIERVNVVTNGEQSTARATVAGMVGLNHGTIYRCTSSLPVYGATPTTQTDGNGSYTGFVGGIAAVSVSPDGTSMAAIDGCTVNAAVNGAATIKGGGIAGYATGRVSNNTFEYGITIKQGGVNFKNIFAEAGAADLRAYGNGWPTTAVNPINAASPETNPNKYGGTLYDGVIDCQEELAMLLSAAYNVMDRNYRISKSFT
ncbi:MAG: fimbrillin family protein, partial [Bacteroidales bacterium]|nr:fimbrillin family protein [Bacteroidales bacterium]